MSESGYDYVIVGAGSAGCTLAARLTEDPGVRVLLLESGGKDRSPNIKIPAAFGKQFHTKLDWDYSTVPQAGCANRELYSPRGRSLGGSSSMNAMLYVRGRPIDYDLWESEGATGWGWQDVEPYFRRAEDHAGGADEIHGAGGPLRTMKVRSPHDLTNQFYAAAEAAGIPYNRDYNGPEQDGVSPSQVTQHGGKRWSAADAYLKPNMKRPNLTVRTNATVLGLDLEGDRVTGVRLSGRRGRTETVRADRDVVLCAGAYGSPQLLMVSGIGPADHLADVGVDVRHDLPGVGQNLHDHPFCVCIWDAHDGPSLLDAEKPRALLEWVMRKSGPLTSPVAEALGFVKTRPGLPAADVQFHMAPAYYVDHGETVYEGHACTIGPVLVTPKSRGQLTLRTADPSDHPLIDPNALSEPEDVESMLAGMELAREIARSGPYAQSLGKELFPGPDVTDRQALEDDLRQRVELIYHPVGTCRIGPLEAGGVVDPDLRVHGIEGLRVVDASVMPVVPGGNTNAPTIMVAEKAADHILGKVPTPA
ncbi:MAG TPA: GMC family oxidoreductase N-terminal domain-containing protein [Thermoleophilaceae bacterium]|nr:GMC family oxidoreductase N-terminal domain-containing protein [Thermoleophilaceae bacterium]